MTDGAQRTNVSHYLAAALVGAVARREEMLGAAIDLLLISKDAVSMKRCVERLSAIEDSLLTRFGVSMKVISYDLATARAMWRTRTPAAERGVNEAELLVGAPLVELLG